MHNIGPNENRPYWWLAVNSVEQLGPELSKLLAGTGLSSIHVRMEEVEAARLVRSQFGVTGVAKRVAAEKDDTFRVEAADGCVYILKVSQPAEDDGELGFQTQLLKHVSRHDPSIPIPTAYPNVHGRELSRIVDQAGQARVACLLSYLDGTTLDVARTTPFERERLGRMLAKLRLATANFSHPLQFRDVAWDVQHVIDLEPLITKISRREHREQLTAAMNRIVETRDCMIGLRSQVLHNDFSESNILIRHGSDDFVTGVFDFGDAVHTAIAIDVATAIVNLLPHEARVDDDIFQGSRDFVRGYMAVADLTSEELALLPHLVMSRLVTRALITLWRAQLFPDNTGYILRKAGPGWEQLEWLLQRPPDQMAEAFGNLLKYNCKSVADVKEEE